MGSMASIDFKMKAMDFETLHHLNTYIDIDQELIIGSN